MKMIGLIGGMSCESTAHYYKRLNERVRAQLGGLHSADILMWSVDFAPVALMQEENHWQEAGVYLGNIGRRLEQAGAELLVLATNTMHKVADAIEASTRVPLIHIADATARKIQAAGKHRPGDSGDALHHGTGILYRPVAREIRPGCRCSRTGRSRARASDHL